MRIPVYYVNAFTSQPFRGNPAAVCFLDSWLDDESLRKVAAENNLSATAFLVGRNTEYRVRWFSARTELRLCGHATLAAAHIVLKQLEPSSPAVRFETKHHGNLVVQKDGDLLAMNLPAFPPSPLQKQPDELLQALGNPIDASEVLEVNETYVAVFDDPATIQSIRPNFAHLENLHPRVVSVTARADDADFVSRYFAPSYGTPEDPATGSALCILAPYWGKRLGKAHLYARQLSARGGDLWCDLQGDRVIVKGEAMLTFQGELPL